MLFSFPAIARLGRAAPQIRTGSRRVVEWRTNPLCLCAREVCPNTPYPAGLVDLPQAFPLAADVHCSFSPEPQPPHLGSKPPPKRGLAASALPTSGPFWQLSVPTEWPTRPSARLERRRSPPQGWLRRSQSPGQWSTDGRLRPQGRSAQSGFRLDIGGSPERL